MRDGSRRNASSRTRFARALWERHISSWGVPDQGVDVTDQRIQVHGSREHRRSRLIPGKPHCGPGNDRGPNRRKSVSLLVKILVKKRDLRGPRKFGAPKSLDEPVSQFPECLRTGPYLFTHGLVARLQRGLEAPVTCVPILYCAICHEHALIGMECPLHLVLGQLTAKDPLAFVARRHQKKLPAARILQHRDDRGDLVDLSVVEALAIQGTTDE